MKHDDIVVRTVFIICLFIQDVFGVSTSAQIDIDKTRLVERDNPMSRFVY